MNELAMFNKILNIFIAILCLISLLSAQEKKVLFIGIDGCRADALETAITPNMDTLIQNGFFINDALCSINGQPTVSGPGWSSMIMGVWYDKHGVSDNSFAGSNFDQYPPFNVLLEEYGEEFHTASFIMWSPIHSEIFSGSMDYNELHPSFDGSMAQAAADYMATEELDIMFLDFDHVDHAGHTYGFNPDTPQYTDTIREVDEYIGWVISAMESRPNFDNEEWLILITSDHGGLSTSHGGQSIEERTIPIIISGSSAYDLNLPDQVYIVDLVPTIIQYMGENIDCSWDLDGNPIGLNPDTFPPFAPCPACPFPLLAERNQTNYSISLSWSENTNTDYTYSLFRNQELLIQLDGLSSQYTDYPNLIGIEGEFVLNYSIVLESDSEESICDAEATTELSTGITLLDENFNGLQLFPAVDEALFSDGGCTNTIPQDILGWTHEPPDDWSIDNSLMPDSGTLEWRGWSFASIEFWVMAEDQLRSQFTKATGNVAVVDPDEWDDCDDGSFAGPYNSILSSPYLFISGDHGLELTFDSHFRNEAPQHVYLKTVTSLGEENILLHYSDDPGSDNAGGDVLNEHLVFTLTHESDDLIQFNWEMADAGNNWYWAIDNVLLQIQTPALGDLNENSQINILDIIILVNIILDDTIQDEIITHISDLNNDGLTNIIDIILLMNYILNV